MQLSSEVEISEDEYKKLSNILHFIALKYKDWSGVEYDDLYLELWIKTIEIISYMGRVDYKYISKCCYNRSLDICRRAKNNLARCYTNTEYLESSDEVDYIRYSEEDFIGNVVVQDIANLFPKNSPEHNYVVYLALYINSEIDEHIEKNLTYDKVFSKFSGDRRELALAKALGYANDTSVGYRNAKYAVREKLKELYAES